MQPQKHTRSHSGHFGTRSWILLTVIMSLSLTGCASQQLAQSHWQWLTQNKGITPGYSTGVSVSTYTVNGQSYQVIAPAR